MSGIAGAPSGPHRGCSETTEGTKAIDRVTLEKVIDASEDAWSGDSYAKIPYGDLHLICRAARAHLATLPEPPKTKMMWGVSAGAELGWVHFDTYEAAEKALRDEVWSGSHRAITIQYREVPA